MVRTAKKKRRVRRSYKKRSLQRLNKSVSNNKSLRKMKNT